MRRGGDHAKFETYQSFRTFEDELVDCGVFSDEWRKKMLELVEQCMKHSYQRGYEHGVTECEHQFREEDQHAYREGTEVRPSSDD